MPLPAPPCCLVPSSAGSGCWWKPAQTNNGGTPGAPGPSKAFTHRWKKRDPVTGFYDVCNCLCCIVLPLHVTVKTEWRWMTRILEKTMKLQWSWTPQLPRAAPGCSLVSLTLPASAGPKSWEPISICAKLKAATEQNHVLGREKRWENTREEKDAREKGREQWLQISCFCQHVSAVKSSWIS